MANAYAVTHGGALITDQSMSLALASFCVEGENELSRDEGFPELCEVVPLPHAGPRDDLNVLTRYGVEVLHYV